MYTERGFCFNNPKGRFAIKHQPTENEFIKTNCKTVECSFMTMIDRDGYKQKDDRRIIIIAID